MSSQPSKNTNMPPTKPIAIIGAGLSGLTLSRALRAKGIPSIIYDKGRSDRRPNYAITLHAWAWRPLARVLGMEYDAFKRAVAVDGAQGGLGALHDSARPEEGDFRANRGTLEAMLVEGLDVKWEHELSKPEKGDAGYQLHFKNQPDTVPADVIVAADGVHSTVRSSFLPTHKPDVLPFVTFNSKQRVATSTYNSIYSPAMAGATTLEMRTGSTLLQISLIGHDDAKGVTQIGSTYSRPADQNNDKLHDPSRSTAGASNIPSELFDELAALNSLDLPAPFAHAFDVENFKSGRLLHWLMRTTSVPSNDLKRLAEQNVVLIGDAAHAQPIIGGNGANVAIRDAIELSEWIGEGKGMEGFVAGRAEEWKEGVEASRGRIGEMHGIEENGGARSAL